MDSQRLMLTDKNEFDGYHLFRKECHEKSSLRPAFLRQCLKQCVLASRFCRRIFAFHGKNIEYPILTGFDHELRCAQNNNFYPKENNFLPKRIFFIQTRIILFFLQIAVHVAKEKI